MDRDQLQEYINKLAVESENLHEFLIDLGLYSNGSIPYRDLLQMPMQRIKQVKERLEHKMKKDAGSKGQEYL